MEKVVCRGRHLAVNGAPFRVKGVTYGSFATRLDGFQFPDSERIKSDLLAIATAGLNTIRTYTLPPPELIDGVSELELRLIVGLHYDDWRMESDLGRRGARRILENGRRAVHEAMAVVAGEACVLAIAVGNEVPVDLVRLHGAGAVEDVLSELIDEVHRCDPQMLATYSNFPTTEFLRVEGQDLYCYNVFLEQPDRLREYLAHLQIVSRDRPLVITELGLAGRVHGEEAQADSLRWQLGTIDEVGCAGATVFSWTDDWAVDDEPVTGWGFGLLTEERTPKPALRVVSEWASTEVADLRDVWPKISVIVCAYNEEKIIGECLTSLRDCRYPDLEVIVCDDGSTDRTVEIARQFPFRILELSHGGLSRARNEALATAEGEIVAYIDADAACHPDWPFYLALSLEDEAVAATGGPNLPHPDAGLVEEAVALSPGAPMEVLTSPDRAEHVPGCNMAFRREALQQIGGFNPVFTAAGDDVDVCWKLLDEGYQIGFASAAEVLHHRRDTVTGYLRQQWGYGRAERLLSGPHRHRFNGLGQARWAGFVYGGSRVLPSLFRPVIYTGSMGTALFQPVINPRAERVSAWAAARFPLILPLMLLGLVLSPLSAWWLAVPSMLSGLAVFYGVLVAIAVRLEHDAPRRLRLRALVGLLHVLQPMARAGGRITGKRANSLLSLPAWEGDRPTWLHGLKRSLEHDGLAVRSGKSGTTWDLEVTGGWAMSARITTAVVWGWEPRLRVSYKLRPRLLSLIAGAVFAFGLQAPAVGWLLLLVSVLWLVIEYARLRDSIRQAVDRTTNLSHVQ